MNKTDKKIHLFYFSIVIIFLGFLCFVNIREKLSSGAPENSNAYADLPAEGREFDFPVRAGGDKLCCLTIGDCPTPENLSCCSWRDECECETEYHWIKYEDDGWILYTTSTKKLNYAGRIDFCDLSVVECKDEKSQDYTQMAEKTLQSQNFASGEIIWANITAYSSTFDQTDDNPLITASSQKVRQGIIANNCQSFGTKIKINNQIYEVQDRMNKRYNCNVFDIWMPTKEKAKEWGIKKLQIEIL